MGGGSGAKFAVRPMGGERKANVWPAQCMGVWSGSGVTSHKQKKLGIVNTMISKCQGNIPLFIPDVGRESVLRAPSTTCVHVPLVEIT